jgi:hypothetical protein
VAAASNQQLSEQIASTPEANAEGEAIVKDRAYYRKEFGIRWGRVRKGVLSVARLIADARFTLPPEEWAAFCKEDIRFEYSMTQKFIKMGLDHRLNDPDNEEHLPNTWPALYEVMQIKQSLFSYLISKKLIGPQSTAAELRELRSQYKDYNKRKKSDAELPAGLFEKQGRQAGTETAASAAGSAETKPESQVAQEAGMAAGVSVPTEAPPTEAGFLIADTSPRPITEPLVILAGTIPSVQALKKGRITITLSHEVAYKNQQAVAVITKLIEGVVAPYDFIESVVTVEVV